MHFGAMLLIAARQYPKLHDVGLEIIQNAIDANAKRIWFRMNYKTRTLVVRDDGDGATPVEFNAALKTVATPGRKGDGKLGQFAIGLVSPLGKCKTLRFISKGKNFAAGFTEWEMNCSKVIASPVEPKVDVRPRLDLTQETAKPGQTKVDWSSQWELVGIIDDKRIAHINRLEFVNDILAKFDAAMRKNDVRISIEIVDENGRSDKTTEVTVPEFIGTPIGVREVDYEGGKTTFNINTTAKPSKEPGSGIKLRILGKDFGLPWRDFARQTKELLSAEILDAFSLGLLHGEITSNKCILLPSRKALEDDEWLLRLCVSIETWWEQVGKDHVSTLKEAHREVRYQEIGIESMGKIEELLKLPENRAILDVVRSAPRGSIGRGHARVAPSRVEGETPTPAISTNGSHPSGSGQHVPSSVRTAAEKERDSHTPMTVAGPSGEKRKVVRGSSSGLQFRHEQLMTSNEFCVFEQETGTIVFNTRHPLWAKCEKFNEVLSALHVYCTVQVLTVHSQPPSTQDAAWTSFTAGIGIMCDWFLKEFVPKKPGRKKKPTE